jgi:uncharacterized protein YjgD (DUF1641 family)
MGTTEQTSKLEDILQELEAEKQMESLHYLVQKLPEFTTAIRSLEDKLAFVDGVINDKQSLDALGAEVEEKVGNLHLNQEHFDAMLEIAHLLPRMVPIMKKAEDITLFVNDILADTDSVEYALKGVNDILPIAKGIKIINETNDRFHADQSEANVSIVGMYRLLKDPVIQKGFKYMETLLYVVKEK